ncbi:hydrogenase expression/formation protein HypE [candidate division KSB1 bacterium]|nr:hydrogenase expression/formation protein HypE [candidate division KSB1 bacterium]
MKTDKILLDHGSGGRASHKLISELILKYFHNPILADLEDSASIQIGNTTLAFSTDSYTVTPLFFPGGNIGELAINGTVNDLAMRGAKPLYLSVGFIIEEGFPISDLEKILGSMQKYAAEADVLIVTGDTKVVPKLAADKIFINTSGVGIIPDGINISGKNARPGDKVIVSGTIADHGITILTQREGLNFDSPLKSDSAPLNHLVKEMMDVSDNIHVLRDPTRGGVGTTLNEIASQSNVGIKLFEDDLPIRDEVNGACELLGLDPLYLANEGKLLAFVNGEDAKKILETMQKNKYGKDATIIGEVTDESPGKVFLKTTIGGTRIVDMLTGEQLPRIC